MRVSIKVFSLFVVLAFSGALFMVAPLSALAANFRTDANIAQTENVSGNMYISGSTPVIAGNIDGDLTAAGGTIVMSGTVTQDELLAGGNINVTGMINGDLRSFGGNIYFDGTTGGDLMAAGGNVRLGPNAVVGGDLIIYAGKVAVDPAAKITGKRTVMSGEEYAQAEKEAGKNINRLTEFLQAAFLIGQLIAILSLLLVAAIFFGVFPAVTNAVVSNALEKNAVWKNVGLGFLMFIVIPIAAVLCFITGIGWMLGLILIFAFIIYLLISSVLAGVIFGGWLYKVTKKPKKLQIKWWSLATGVILLHIISLIPFLGWIVSFIFVLLTWGAIARTQWSVIRAVK
jgi:hypothetical protein